MGALAGLYGYERNGLMADGAAQRDDRTFQQFMRDVEKLLNGTAAGKGYSASGPDGENPLYEFIASMNNGHGHALGEIVYKARRYAAKGNPEDILKCAAWAFLVWKHR